MNPTNNIKDLQSAVSETQKYITFLEKSVKASELDGLEIQKIENCGAPFGKYYAISHYETVTRDGRHRNYGKNSPEETAEICRKLNAENLAWVETTHAANLPKIAINQKKSKTA
jgi:hypothetical protein